MELDNIKLQTTWNDAAGSINLNFLKLKQAIAALIAEGGGLDEEQLAAYLQANGYTTEQWVALQEFIKLGSLDTEIKADSVNAVQNKAIKAYVDKVAQEAEDTAIRGALNGLSADEIYIKYIENKMSLLLAQDGGLGTPEGMQGLGIVSIPEGLLSDYAKKEEISKTFATIAALNLVDGRLTAIEDYFSSEGDADTLINKWNEIVAFLNATEGTTLDNILSSKANKSDIPTKVGQLENDKGYITSAALEGYLKSSGGTLSGSIDFGRHPLLSEGAEFLLSLGGVYTYLKGSTGIWLETPELYTNRDNKSYRVLDLGMDIDAKTLGGLAETAFYRGMRASINVSDLDTYVSRDVGAYSVAHSGHTSALLVLSKLTGGSNTSVEIYAPSYNPSLGLRLRFGIDSNIYSDWRDFAFLDDTIYAAYKLVNSRGDDIVTINSYNNVIIGASGADSANYKLYVDGDIRAKNAIKIGDAIISWDNELGALKIVGNVYATGQVAAGGFGDSDGGSGGGVILDYDSVVAALGFTPFDSAAFTKTSIKNALGITDWALAANKPSYNFSEIGSKPTTLSGYGITDAMAIGPIISAGQDLNNYKTPGSYMLTGGGILNQPVGDGTMLVMAASNKYFTSQLVIGYNGVIYTRMGESQSWTDWKVLADSSQFTLGEQSITTWADLKSILGFIEIAQASEHRATTDNSAFATYSYGDNGWKVAGPALAFANGGYKGLLNISIGSGESSPTHLWISSVREGTQQPWVEVLTEANISSLAMVAGQAGISSGQDLNDLFIPGSYHIAGGPTNAPQEAGDGSLLVVATKHRVFSSQLLVGWNGVLYLRGAEGNSWKDWRTVLDTTNIGDYALLKTGGTITGNLTLYGQSALIGDIPTGGIYPRFRMFMHSNGLFFQAATYDGTSKAGNVGFTGYQGVAANDIYFNATTIRFLGASSFNSALTVGGLLTANRGIRVASGQALSFIDAGGTEHSITYDSAANAFKVDGSMYALGQLAAGEKGEEQKKVFDISSSATSSEYVITHNFQTYEVSVAVYKVTPATGSTSEIWTQVIVDIEITSADSIKVSFYSKPSNTAYKVVVIG